MTGTIAGFTSTGIDDNATSTAITIDASENVGIGATSALRFNGTTDVTHAVGYDSTVDGAFIRGSAGVRVLTGGATGTERMRIASTGDVTVNTGNLVIGTSGKGIDFSADGNAAGMTSEVLDDYETGTWTPTNGTFSTWTTPTFDATYTKIGRLVTASFRQTGGTIAADAAGDTIFGLPYAPRIASTYGGSVSNSGNAELGFANVHTNSSFYFTSTINAQTAMSYTVTYETA
jgi:hypothetical protein